MFKPYGNVMYCWGHVGVMLAPCWNHVGPCKDTVEEQFDKIERQKENVQHRRVQNSAHSTARSEPPAVHCPCATMGAGSPHSTERS